MPNFVLLRSFEAAARLQSFSLAAQELHLTPSAISHQIKSLESYFDKALFLRRKRGVELSHEGQRFYKNLGPILDSLERLCLDTAHAPATDMLKLHCSPSYAVKWLGPRLNDFLRDHPALTVQLTTDAQAPDLHTELGVDLTIAYGAPPGAQAGLIIEPLGNESIVPMCSPELLDTLPVGALWHECLPLIHSQLSPVTWGDWFSAQGMPSPNDPRVSFDRGALAVAAAVDGMGVVLETTRFAEKEISSGRLVILSTPENRPLTRSLHFLCFRSSQKAHQKLQIFRYWLHGAARL